MPSELSQERLIGFLLVLARISGVMAFFPVPGWKRSPEAARIVLTLALAIVLMPVWPKAPAPNPTLGDIAIWVAREISWGLLLGLAVNIVVEGFVLAAQCIGLQAGFSYASTIDPGSDADSTVLQVFAQLTANLLFFAFRMDEELVRALAGSIVHHPPGTWSPQWSDFQQLAEFGAEMWRTSLRLAIPILSLLVLLDLAIALYGKVQAQVQLVALSFPIKILMSLAALGALTAAMPGVLRTQLDRWLVFAMR